MLRVAAAVGLALLATVSAAPFETGTGLLPLGNLFTTDAGGPYNLSLLSVQQNEVKAALAARGSYTDADIVNFLTNVECLEGRFDSMGTLGLDFNDDLTLGGPDSVGYGKANLSSEVLSALTEVAVSEQGHALFTRHAGGVLPCPYVNYTAGFNDVLAAAYGLAPGEDISRLFGVPFDPLYSDETFLLSVVFLEELGATGNKGLISLISNPVIADGVSGLATSATAFAAIERFLLFQRRNVNVYPTNETVAQVFARLSALRDALDGPQFDDQGLLNTDPRFIAIAVNQTNTSQYINNIPTDVQGLTFSRTPQMIINILTLGSPTGVGGFFPSGLVGNITSPAGYNLTASGTESWGNATEVNEETFAEAGTLQPPLTAEGPFMVPGELDLTQAEGGPLTNDSYLSRGFFTTAPQLPRVGQSPMVMVGTPSGTARPGGYGGK
ncbi:hypothetical protein WJX74_009810 [Apatococcus lobatus]|uniref:Uncharacterized protein n=1 Tax=Apatococcus lobatus TaxID=904363 RepID=A0AAW1RYD5_9CHLO